MKQLLATAPKQYKAGVLASPTLCLATALLAGILTSPATAAETSKQGASPAAGATIASVTYHPALNDDQRLVVKWTDREFRSFLDARTFDGWSDKEKAELETRLLDTLNGPHTREYYQAINSLAVL